MFGCLGVFGRVPVIGVNAPTERCGPSPPLAIPLQLTITTVPCGLPVRGPALYAPPARVPPASRDWVLPALLPCAAGTPDPLVGDETARQKPAKSLKIITVCKCGHCLDPTSGS